jgi:hypothetical protein
VKEDELREDKGGVIAEWKDRVKGYVIPGTLGVIGTYILGSGVISTVSTLLHVNFTTVGYIGFFSGFTVAGMCGTAG